LFVHIPKARAAKIVKTLVDTFSEIPGAQQIQIDVCRDTVAWCTKERRVFLRQQLETRLIALYLEQRMHTEAIALISRLLTELKRLDDKIVLVEVHLLESRVYHALRNLAKSRAALTSARTNANAIYTPQLLQASLDLQSGILHMEEHDFNTAQSYFLEALEAFSIQGDSRATLVVKYLCLSKVMLNQPEEVELVLRGKHVGKWGEENGVKAVKEVSEAQKKGSLREFEEILTKYKHDLSQDPVVRTHLAALYDTLLERNLSRCVLPYSRVEVAWIASQLVQLPLDRVEAKLSQMILDKKFNGVWDHGSGCLIVYEEPEEDKTYEEALATMKHMENVVDSLFEKANKLT